MTLDDFVEQTIGAPFRPHGRGPTYDCYGLVVHAYRQVLGIEVADYGGDYPRFRDHAQLNAVVDNACLHDWWRVDYPQPMDAVVIYRDGLPIHIGLYVGGGQVLHIEHGINATVQPVTDFRIEGYYRPTQETACA